MAGPSDTKPLRIALIGFGTVGGGVAKILTENPERTAARAGRSIEITSVCVRDVSKPRTVSLEGVALGTDPVAAAQAADADCVVELIGGTTTAKEVVLAALNAGKDVVTANKALVCEHGPELFAAARAAGRSLSFEAAVAGGIPVIATLTQSLTSNGIQSIEGVLNGTSNYILTEMVDNGLSYSECLKNAQDLGYAEADPTMDVDGTDAAQKLTILAHLAFGARITPDKFRKQGIDTLTLSDLLYAQDFGYVVKLLGTAKRVGDNSIEMHVEPTLLQAEDPIARVHGALNMVAFEGDAVGPVWLAGPGAGQMPTASAVVADLIDVASGRAAITFRSLDFTEDRMELTSPDSIERRYYLRFSVDDRPGVLASIASTLTEESISIASVVQSEGDGTAGSDTAPEQVPLVIMTHTTTEAAMRRALSNIAFDGICLPVAV